MAKSVTCRMEQQNSSEAEDTKVKVRVVTVKFVNNEKMIVNTSIRKITRPLILASNKDVTAVVEGAVANQTVNLPEISVADTNELASCSNDKTAQNETASTECSSLNESPSENTNMTLQTPTEVEKLKSQKVTAAKRPRKSKHEAKTDDTADIKPKRGRAIKPKANSIKTPVIPPNNDVTGKYEKCLLTSLIHVFIQIRWIDLKFHSLSFYYRNSNQI